MGRSPPTLAPRNLGELLSETFALYGRHFRWFMGLAAVVQVPMSILTLAMTRGVGGGSITFTAAMLLSFAGTMFVYGAAVCAVGQHHLSGVVKIGDCYARVGSWFISILLLSLILGVTLLLVPLAVSLTADSVAAGFISLLLIPAIVVFIYWSMAIQAVVVEGHKAVNALRRSYALIKGSWWRVFGISLVVGLVALGLAILITVPFAVLSSAMGVTQSSGLDILLDSLGSIAVEIAVAPVVFIAGTLLYYDLRVRKEQYDLSVLSQEMGTVAT